MGKQKNIKSLNDPAYFEEIFREYFKPLTYYAQKIVHDHDSAKEIAHSVFINLWERKDTIHLETSLKSYLFTAVHNRSLNLLRDKSKFYTGDIADLQYRDEFSVDVTDKISESETEAKIMAAIASLPERCGEIFKLSRFESKKYKEIADELKISVKTVEIQMSKALRILREELKDYLDAFILLIIYFLFNNL